MRKVAVFDFRGGVALAAIALCAHALPAEAEAVTYRFDIPAQDLGAALKTFATVSHQQVGFDTRSVRGKRSAALNGDFTPGEALAKLLAGSGLVAQSGKSGVILIRPVSTKDVSRATEAPDVAASAEADVIVTGTHIRGAALASPVVRISNQQMREAGQRDLGDVIRDIPSNYTGGQNPGARFQAGTAANTNASGSSALNLRGLGPDATLTLLNGRRLPYDGSAQAVDVSAIPIDAVREIQTVPDGASALYGSDAVAGVANVVLRSDYDGIATTVRIGTATDGGGFINAYDAVGGKHWGSGGALLALQFDHQNAVRSDQRDYTRYVVSPNTLLDAHKHFSVLGTAHQDITATLTFSIDALYSWRHSDGAEYSDPGFAATTRYTNENYSILPSLTWRLPDDWTATLAGSFGRNDTHRFDDYIDEATGENDGGETFYRNYAYGAEADVEGRLFSLPGGDVRLAAGGGYRFNHLHAFSPTRNNGDGGIGNAYGFGEMSVPLVSDANALPLLHQLSISAALRHEEYDRFGGVTTPKFGLVYAPTHDLDLKFSWGRSFKAPTLSNQYTPYTANLQKAAAFGGGAFPSGSTVLITGGGNPDLKPERARTWSTSLDLHPHALAGLNISATYFDIDYTDRVVQPVSNGGLGALTNPAVQQFVDYAPSEGQQAALIARTATGLRNSAGAAYDPAKVVAVINNTLVNAARQRIHGVDLGGTYKMPISSGDIIVSGQGSWLESRQRNTAALPAFDLAGTNFNPPHFRARGGVTGHFATVTAAIFANYIGSIHDENVSPPAKGTDMTTLDLSLMWKTPDRPGALHGIELGLFVQNFTNATPPYLAPFSDTTVNYDSTNYSPLGRFISLSLRKAW